MKRAVIFAGGGMDTDAVWRPELYRDALILCADGGWRHAERLGVIPDCIIGDCDSAAAPYPEEIPHHCYPPEKDKTDTQLCLEYAIEAGCEEICLLGGLGGRLDHEFSHYALLLYAKKRGVNLRLMNGGNEIWLADRSFTLAPGDKKYISFFPYGGAVEHFTIKGLKYEAEDMTLTCDRVQASSNEFLPGRTAEISFQSGYLLVMCCQD